MKNTIITIACITVFSLPSLSGQGQPVCEPGELRPQLSGDYTTITDSLPALGPPNGSSYVGARGPEDYRMVYFVHGLNGTGAAWQRPSAALEDDDGNGIIPREVYTKNVDYNLHQNSFFTASGSVRQQLDPAYDVPSDYLPIDGIMIGHSQGGLVGRYTDRYYSQDANLHTRKFGGLVTFGTSNQGAQILNNINQLHGVIDKLATDLSAGPVSEFGNNDKIIIRLIARFVKAEKLADAIKDMLVFDIGSTVIAGNTPGITGEYIVGSPAIDVLNTYVPRVYDPRTEQIRNTNLVAFYGVRENVRVFDHVGDTSIVSFQENMVNGEFYPVYEYKSVRNLKVPISLAAMNYFVNEVTEVNNFRAMEEEWKLAFRMHFLRLDYVAKELENRLKVEKHGRRRSSSGWIPVIGSFLEGLNYDKMVQAKMRQDAWSKGIEVLDDLDRRYKIAVGIRKYEGVDTFYTEYCKCRIDNLQLGTVEYDFPEYIKEPGEDCGEMFEYMVDNFLTEVNCQTVTRASYRPVWRETPSDGVVLAESAMNIPQHTHEPQEMLNSTHMSMRNDKNTIRAMNDIFDGEVGDFFRTEAK